MTCKDPICQGERDTLKGALDYANLQVGELQKAARHVVDLLGTNCRFDHDENCQTHFCENPCSVRALGKLAGINFEITK